MLLVYVPANIVDVLGGSVYGDDNKVLEEVQAYSESKSVIKKNHPMLIMVCNIKLIFC